MSNAECRVPARTTRNMNIKPNFFIGNSNQYSYEYRKNHLFFQLQMQSQQYCAPVRHTGMSRRRRTTAEKNTTRIPVPAVSWMWLLGCFLFLVVSCVGGVAAATTTTTTTTTKENGDPMDFLDENSVVLITGAAGFIGSELALALHRTYSPKRILCVDRMGDHPSTQEELALFEFQRQRAFHVLQTLGAKGRFYRVDFRPMIPEYFDVGEVPVLDHIFRENPDISHIVHLADAFPHSALQAVPREKDAPKAGMIEALLEQMLKIKTEGGHVPHFSYASSYEVYPYASNVTMTPLTESHPISTPSSLRGASKLIDEILAKLYFDEHGLYSVALRFFSVYGPWSVPGSPLFEMAERAVGGQLPSWNSRWKPVQDFVYIDDAIDAVMAAMQFRPAEEKPHPLVINVASGQGTSLQDVATIMREYFPPNNKESDYNTNDNDTADTKPKTIAFGSTQRAEEILGYQPQVSLKDGIIKLLAWHFDRAYPYGRQQNSQEDDKSNYIASRGIVSCLPTDDECLKATPVFPCSSECSHEDQCTKSFYDEIVGWTQALTAQCKTVLYTVAMENSLTDIPSAHVKLQTTSESFFDGTCNIAFVSETSPLVQSLRGSNPISAFMGSDRSKLLKTGKWILIPVLMPSFPTGEEHILSLLPKLSPGLFFGPNTKRAIYVDPDILLDSIPKLLQEASMQPYNAKVEGATAMLIGKGKPNNFFAQGGDDFVPKKQVFKSTNSIIQNSAYRMVRIAVSDKLFGDGFAVLLDSRWMVHTLQSDDSRLFRCDVFGEVVQWDVDEDRSALEFVLGLHDMWSRVIAEKPWWMGENVVTVPEGANSRRRLQEEDEEDEEEEGDASGDGEEVGDEEEEEEVEEDEEKSADTEEEEAPGNEDDEIPTVTDGSADVDEEGARAGFGMKGEDVEEVAAGDKKRGDSADRDDDQALRLDKIDPAEDMPAVERDFSAYDAWMGVLSATSVKYFVRIVPSSEVGVVSLHDYEESKIEQ